MDEHEGAHARLAEQTVNAALVRLRQSGERVTLPRRAVVEALARRPEHLRADQIVAHLEGRRPPVHRATVYRALDLLVDLGLVSSLPAEGGAAAYHLTVTPSGAEHLHARCRVCGRITLLPPSALDTAVRALEEESGFVLEPARLTLTGRCATCAR